MVFVITRLYVWAGEANGCEIMKKHTQILFFLLPIRNLKCHRLIHTLGHFRSEKTTIFVVIDDWPSNIERLLCHAKKELISSFHLKKNVSWWWWNIIGCAEIAIREGYIALRCVITIFLVISGTAQKTTVTQKSEIIINETMSLFIFGKCAIQTMTIDTSKKSVIVDLTISLFHVLRMIAKELLWKLVTANVHAIERIFDGKLKWITRKSNRT